MEPLISIIVPVYNVENYLSRCVDSLLNQSYKNLEIILINDGSTDNSGSLCDEYRNAYQSIKVRHHEKSSGSAGSARNLGLKLSSGDYVSFVDSDDWIHPEMMTIMMSRIQENKVKIAECDLLEIDHFYIPDQNNQSSKKYIVEDRVTALKRIINTLRFSVCVRLYDISLVKDIRFLENVISEDVYFTLEVFKRVKELVRIDESLYYYFITPNSVTRKPYSIKYFDSLNSGLYLQNYIHDNENDEELRVITQNHILKKLMYHYKMLNYYPMVDAGYVHRKRLKHLIDKNYYRNINNGMYLKLAKILPVYLFEVLINMNKLRHKVFNTNKFT